MSDHAVMIQLIISTAGFLATVVIAFFGWLISKNANAKLDAVAHNVDGNLSDAKKALESVMKIANDYAGEIVRLQEKGTTTPYGLPSPEAKVTMSAGLPITQESSSLIKDSDG